MYKVSVSVPAVSTNVGPGYDVLGLALNGAWGFGTGLLVWAFGGARRST